MYVAKHNCIYYANPDETGKLELFLTVHPTKDCTKTLNEQAIIICDMLNNA